MDFQFVIPRNNLELLDSDGNKYYVKQVYDARELPEMLKAARNAYGVNVFYIFDHFDTFFSLIENANQQLIVPLVRGIDLIFLTVDKLGKELTEFFGQTVVDSVERESYLNLTKMMIYLCVGFVRAIDEVKKGGTSPDVGAKKGAKRVGGGAGELDVHSWEDRRFKVLVQLLNLFHMPLEKLWSLCIAEESFVDLFCDICYRTLEHPSVTDKRVSDTIFKILGNAIKRYNHALTFPVKILHLLCSSELSVVPATQGLHLLYEDFGIKTIFATLIREFTEAVSIAVNDSQTVKNFILFMSEVAVIDAKMMIPIISSISEKLLNLDSYSLRNCILQIMGDAVATEMSTEELSDEIKEFREEFLEDLHMHLIDTSAQVRSKTLQIWSHMKAESSVPLAWQQKVLETAAERLDDRAVLVRKNAVMLIKSFLETNPFAAKLSLEELKEKYDAEHSKLEAIREKVVASRANEAKSEAEWEEMANTVMSSVAEELSKNTQDSVVVEPPKDVDHARQLIAKCLREKDYMTAVKLVRRIDASNREIAEMPFNDQVGYHTVLLRSYLFLEEDYSEEFTTQEQKLTFYEDSLTFAQLIARVVPIIENMLMSKMNTDVFEAIDFFTTAYLFGIVGAERGMRKMLALVWSGDKEKLESVAKAYHRVFFQTDQQGREHTIKVVANLCSFFEHLNVGQFNATELLMQEWIDNEDINNQVIQVLFERMTLKLEDTSNNICRLALRFLVMAATVKPSIAIVNFDLIQSIAFGDRCYNDPRIFVDCLALLSCQKSSDPNHVVNHHEQGSDLIEKALECYRRLFFHPDTPNFDDITTKTMDFIYQFGDAPDVMTEGLLKKLVEKMTQIANKNVTDTQNFQSNIAPSYLNNLPDFLLVRFIHFVGYIALKEMVFLDVKVYTHMKYWKEVEDDKKKSKTGSASKRKTILNQNLSASASKALKRLSETAAEQQDDEVLDGATAEDTIAEMINEVLEERLLYDPNALFHHFIPIVMEILKSPGKFRDQRLQQAACLTLIRMMTISGRFCETNMPFLMNVMTLTKNVKIKCNIIVGLCDLTFRFPNVIQLWTSHIYGTLHEKNDEIRLTAVKVLSHLIQHEMIRVKGQISDLAMCIVDKNEDIRNITQEFFKEISQKSNILYNVLPDIISRLSDSSMNLIEEQYHVIMRHVMGLINKDRQVESLVEKLCLRFKVTNEERQWRDIAFCLSLLTYTEKTIKKLIDHVHHFKDKVQVDEVYECFKTIISNTGKLAKPEIKATLAIFCAKLEDCLVVREAGEVIDGGADTSIGDVARVAMPPPKRIPRRSGAKGAKGKIRGRADSDSDSEDESSATQRGRSSNYMSNVRNRKKVADADSSDSSEEEVVSRKRHL